MQVAVCCCRVSVLEKQEFGDWGGDELFEKALHRELLPRGLFAGGSPAELSNAAAIYIFGKTTSDCEREDRGITEAPAKPYRQSHNDRTTTFQDPVTGVVPIENCIFKLEDKPKPNMSHRAGGMRGEGGGGQRPTSIASEMSNHTLASEASQEQIARTSRSSKKNAAFGKRSNSMKRNPKANVLKSGWLFKQVQYNSCLTGGKNACEVAC
ncbi:hypothetical protein scyTo_0005408 [Scyliorhinus torazame]|uniref:Uncharacterized protein n=1 Tax=Scyliorhinus torazame TaxID=75743 RepID=A0A401P7A7_SCYTO|nr:hypothetical protein [Scyliorhinus torazame]